MLTDQLLQLSSWVEHSITLNAQAQGSSNWLRPCFSSSNISNVVTAIATAAMAFFTWNIRAANIQIAKIEEARRNSELPCIQYQVRNNAYKVSNRILILPSEANPKKYIKIMFWNNSFTPTTIIDHYFILNSKKKFGENQIIHKITASTDIDRNPPVKIHLPITIKAGEGIALYYTLGTNNNKEDLQIFPDIIEKWEEYSKNWDRGKLEIDVFKKYIDHIQLFITFNNIHSNDAQLIDLKKFDVIELRNIESSEKL
ncbi:MAG: hypothetical protein DKM50_04285 [Candidatus Margulisiibacteriota bacterium]|nr:MAG: hypothetical protein DKM50_04285 [Candidatus Margulisiibacteriota bacterium]